MEDKIRNIAVIAHVDHGKTTLVDNFLKQSNMFRENSQIMQDNLIMDNNELERERGITITAKNLYILYKGYKINIIDTPGHADFAGEVERTLNMADGCLLIVDSQEGPMPQTRYVLKKALNLNKKVIVIINKIDKKFANIDNTLSKISDLFLDLAHDENQLDFPVFYAIAKNGLIFDSLPDISKIDSLKGNFSLLFESIIKDIPSPKVDKDKPFLMQVSAIDYDEYSGAGIIGKILQGRIKIGNQLKLLKEDQQIPFKVVKIIINNGVKKEEIENASAGDIITLIGVKDAKIGDTIASLSETQRLPDIEIQEPSIKMKFEANTSPLSGKEGEFVTSRQLLERLQREMAKNVSMKLEIEGDSFFISGRGELHLSILIETLRREKYEFQISKSEAIKKIIDGKKFDPEEELFIDVDKTYMGDITTELSKRNARLLNIINEENGRVQFYYNILTKNLLGLRGYLVNKTKGTAVINSNFLGYKEYERAMKRERKGVLISSDQGVATAYSLNKAQERGSLFIAPGTSVYKGMIVGINKYEQDMEVNVVRGKHLTNIHTVFSDDKILLIPTIPVSIEFGIDFINDDEYFEITPKNLRLRKKTLDKGMRARERKIPKNT